MKKLLLTICAAIFSLSAIADEGIWLPALIQSRIADMQSKGFKLTAEDIYSINESSMKDGVMLFGGGCTAELVSDQGLLLTNHHCGYGNIQSHSTVEHDYLTDGFSAKSFEEELPNPTLNVRFLVRMEDVTEQIAAGVAAAEISKAASEEGRYRCSVEPLYYANQWFLFVYEQFDDVRLVAAPPSSIGKFGGDTDNWMWPRHTGDFSVFRIYANTNNEPAKYSVDNVPYTPKHHFKISTKGVEEGDFTMIYGFPGSTQQYITSDAVSYIEHISDPMKIDLRTRRLDIIAAAQEKDPAVRIKYASKHASIANAWKKWQGEALGLGRLKTVEKKEAYERDFRAWAEGTEYATLLDSMSAAYAEIAPAYFNYELCTESVRAIELGSALLRVSYPLDEARMASFYKDYEVSIDRDVAVALLEELQARMEDIPAEFTALIAQYGSTEAYVDYIFSTSALTSLEKITAAATSEEAVAAIKREDPMAQLLAIFAPFTAHRMDAALATRKRSRLTTPPTSRRFASSTLSVRSFPMLTSPCVWLTARLVATHTAMASTTSMSQQSTASSPRITPRSMTTISHNHFATSTPLRAMAAGLWRLMARRACQYVSSLITKLRVVTRDRQLLMARASWSVSTSTALGSLR